MILENGVYYNREDNFTIKYKGSPYVYSISPPFALRKNVG
jgi:hypothetical protein